jgi:hypothetical protein
MTTSIKGRQDAFQEKAMIKNQIQISTTAEMWLFKEISVEDLKTLCTPVELTNVAAGHHCRRWAMSGFVVAG